MAMSATDKTAWPRRVRVGLHTSGMPELTEEALEGIPMMRLHNQLIGGGFHWETTISTLHDGNIEPFNDPVTSTITLVETLPVERYLEAVISSEMNPEAPAEFLKAHAIVARSWLLGKIMRCHGQDPDRGRIVERGRIIDWTDTEAHEGFDVCSSDHCQRFEGIGNVDTRIKDIVKETEGMFLADETGMPADARFSKCCGGHTELFSTCWQDTDYRYLTAHEDPYCDLSAIPDEERSAFLRTILKDYDMQTADYMHWRREVSKNDVRRHLKEKFGIDVGEIINIEAIGRGPSGRIHTLRIDGSRGSVIIGKELMVRRLFSDSHLHSSAFEIEETQKAFILNGRGWGHGVGMCQIGAANMARLGHSCCEILTFYYPNISIRNTNDDKR